VEQHLAQLLQDLRTELEIDIEVDLAAVFVRQEHPVVLQVLEGSFGIGDIDPLPFRIKVDVTGEPLAHHLEADHQIRDDAPLAPFAHSGGQAPGQKLWVAGDVGHQVK
jgi:hypothetical protein